MPSTKMSETHTKTFSAEFSHHDVVQQLLNETARLSGGELDGRELYEAWLNKQRTHQHPTPYEVKLRLDFVEEGSPSYKTDRVKVSVAVTKDMSWVAPEQANAAVAAITEEARRTGTDEG